MDLAHERYEELERHEHLAQVLHLLVLPGGVLHPGELGDPLHQVGHLDRLAAEGVRCRVYGRLKHIYSIYRKMYSQGKTLNEIFDLYAFRVGGRWGRTPPWSPEPFPSA